MERGNLAEYQKPCCIFCWTLESAAYPAAFIINGLGVCEDDLHMEGCLHGLQQGVEYIKRAEADREAKALAEAREEMQEDLHYHDDGPDIVPGTFCATHNVSKEANKPCTYCINGYPPQVP